MGIGLGVVYELARVEGDLVKAWSCGHCCIPRRGGAAGACLA